MNNAVFDLIGLAYLIIAAAVMVAQVFLFRSGTLNREKDVEDVEIGIQVILVGAFWPTLVVFTALGAMLGGIGKLAKVKKKKTD